MVGRIHVGKCMGGWTVGNMGERAIELSVRIKYDGNLNTRFVCI